VTLNTAVARGKYEWHKCLAVVIGQSKKVKQFRYRPGVTQRVPGC
jgi:hypothetical protein